MPALRPQLLIALALASSTALGGMAVTPGSVERVLRPGENVIEVVVSNTGAEDLEIELTAAPMAHDLQGNAIAGPADPSQDLSRLLRFEKPKFLLRARRWRRVRVYVTAPSGSGGLYSLLYVRGTPPARDGGAEVAVSLKLGVLLSLVFPGESERQVELTDLRATSSGPRVRVKNTGDVHVRPAGKVVLRDHAGREVWSGAVIPRVVLPGLERDLQVEGAPTLSAGQYVAEVELTSPTRARIARAVAQVEGSLVVARGASK